LLIVYSGTVCLPDSARASLRALVAGRLSNASKNTDLEIEATQLNLTHTRMPGSAVMAARMKDDLTNAKTRLDRFLNSFK
jgi:hypothetical protein